MVSSSERNSSKVNGAKVQKQVDATLLDNIGITIMVMAHSITCVEVTNVEARTLSNILFTSENKSLVL